MNHLVFLDARAGELEKILSGTKTMLIRATEPAPSNSALVSPPDRLYFLRDRLDCVVRVEAIVVRVLFVSRYGERDLAHALKEMQPRLHLTEGQYNYWAAQRQALFVEFGWAQKLSPFQVDPGKLRQRSDWISFEELQSVTASTDLPLPSRTNNG